MNIKKGSEVTFAYKLYLENGLMDETLKDQPMIYVQGEGQLIPGLEQAMEGLKEGDKETITVAPEDAYGVRAEERIVRVPRKDIPKEATVFKGDKVPGKSPEGDMVLGTIIETNDEFIIIDFNHELAGKTLTFEVEILNVADLTV